MQTRTPESDLTLYPEIRRHRCLVIPDGADPERDAVAMAWSDRGGEVCRLARFWEPPQELYCKDLCLYGPDLFCQVLAQVLDVELRQLDDRFILSLPPEVLGREMGERTLAEFESLTYPCFIKPLQPKLFPAAVHASPNELRDSSKDLPTDTSVLVSTPVTFTAEARSFIPGCQPLDLAIYQGDALLDGAVDQVVKVAASLPFESGYVLDMGRLDTGEWLVVELNPAWGAGLNGCDARLVLPAIASASGRRRD